MHHNTEVLHASWSEETQLWTLLVDRLGQIEEIKSYHTSSCVGAGCAFPNLPAWAKDRVGTNCQTLRNSADYPYVEKSRKTFKGEVLHSGGFRAPGHMNGKKAIVVGTGNTGKPSLRSFLKLRFQSEISL